jgi:hypothetical protein
LRPIARGWVNFRWWASAGLRAQIRHGCDPTNFRWALSRSRRGSLIVSTLLSILPGAVSAWTGAGATGQSSTTGAEVIAGEIDGSTIGLTFLGRPLGRLTTSLDAEAIPNWVRFGKP